MKSIRTKIILLTVSAIVATLTIITLLGVCSIKNIGISNSERVLSLLCETGQRNLNYYLDSIQQSVKTVSDYTEEDLSGTDLEDLAEHLDRVRSLFESTARNTAGVLTYYYRIDPEVSDTKGFWYVDMDGTGFVEHEVTDISLYDMNDQTALVWFTVPRSTGESVWLPPYNTENLDVYVLSYNVPIYKDDLFIGVIGIEIDYTTLAEEVNHIRLYDNGYAFVNDAEGTIVYHPLIPQEDISGENKPTVPDGLLSESNLVRYTFDGVEKEAVWMPLDNGMRLNVTVPVSEINHDWFRLIEQILIVSALLLILFILLSLRMTKRIVTPLQNLTKAAHQVNDGEYDVELEYAGQDEVGVLTSTMRQLVSYLKEYISDLNSLAYADALTSVHNKGAFDIHIRAIQNSLTNPEAVTEFAVGMFDCNYLKRINDQNGHDKGDIYLKTASSLICRVFQHSPVFRTGGDEFAVILQNEDYHNRESLIRFFLEECGKINSAANLSWEHISIALGVAVYDPDSDRTVADVIRRADQLMYEDKRRQKEALGDA